jgi:hypothetical protein
MTNNSITKAIETKAQIVDEPEILRWLPVCRRTLAEWRRLHKIPFIKIGRRILYHRQHVEEALLRMERGGAQ